MTRTDEPSAEAIALATVMWERGELEAALARFSALAERHPDVPAVWEGLGSVRWSLGSFATALHAFQRACRLDPLDPAHWSNIGLCLRDLGSLPAAANALETALLIRSDFAPAWNEWANVLMDQGTPQRADPLYVRALELDGRRAVYHHNRGVCRKRLGDQARARACFEAALALDPRYGHSLYELGLR